MHNGTLSPKDSKDFVLEKEIVVKEMDDKTKVVTEKIKKVKISDSKIFFDEFMKDFSTQTPKDKFDEVFCEHLNETMKKFTGKFAFMFYFHEYSKFYIVRGKSADLYISYLMSSGRKDAKQIGYVINTSGDLLDKCCILLSNLHQLNTGETLWFTPPVILPEESIYVAETDIKKIAEIKENVETTTYYRGGYNQNWHEEGDNSYWKKSSSPSKDEIRNEKVFNFMKEYCLRVKDIQHLFMSLYGVSLLEVEEVVLNHFVTKVIPRLENSTTKKIRRKLARACNGFVRENYYTDKGFEYPWMLNTKSAQLEMCNYIDKFNKELEEKEKAGK